MEEKSLEEMMSDLSDGVITTTASTTDEPFVVDMSNAPIPEVVSVVSQSPIQEEQKPEVQEMIDENENNFYSQNIDKAMDVLEKEYVKMERDAAIIDAKIIKLKQEHKEVFDALEALEKEKEEALTHKDDYRTVIADKLASIGEKKWKGMEVEFTYVAASFKTSFNKKRFEQEQPKLYAQYMDTTSVKAYVKTKLNLLPILPEDLKEVE